MGKHRRTSWGDLILYGIVALAALTIAAAVLGLLGALL